MSYSWHMVFTAILCSGVLWSAARSQMAKPQWQHNPSAIQTFFPPICPVRVFFLSSAKRNLPQKPCMALPSQGTPEVIWARDQRHNQEHIPSAEDPMLELKGQLQFFPKYPTTPLALLPLHHLPTQNQSTSPQALLLVWKLHRTRDVGPAHAPSSIKAEQRAVTALGTLPL